MAKHIKLHRTYISDLGYVCRVISIDDNSETVRIKFKHKGREKTIPIVDFKKYYRRFTKIEKHFNTRFIK